MRVTTERAQSAIKAHHITGNLTNIVKDYAADILEARELIKEMRGLIKDVYVSGLSTSRNCAIDKLLERTKEYI